MEEARLNRIKEQLSLIYISTLSVKLDLAFEDHRGKGKDIRFGIDCTVSKGTEGLNRAEVLSSEVYIQAKATAISSTSMYSEDENNIYYNLSRNIDPSGNFYLVLLVLPHEDDFHTWIEIDPEKLIIRKCAYYAKLDSTFLCDGRPNKVTIPKTNVLNVDTFPTLFLSESDKNNI